MGDPSDPPERNFLRRWSQRKLAAAREAEATPPVAASPAASSAAVAVPQPSRPAVAAEPAPPAAKPELPDVASLTIESDFKPFLAPEVDEGTRRAALRKLFADPHFNTMDGLDVYIDDYSKFEPITPEVLKQLRHARYVLEPPKTRVNEQGNVEDVVEDVVEPAQAEGEGAPESAAEPVPLPAAGQAPHAPADAAQAPEASLTDAKR
ncbi:MAG: DUF3306 domain-containing protein [Betaproteobacteria bacterium]|jgi:hypothetical protein|nr:DUF3306 domain-containing protein [Betaproteobacteria bacterium]